MLGMQFNKSPRLRGEIDFIGSGGKTISRFGRGSFARHRLAAGQAFAADHLIWVCFIGVLFVPYQSNGSDDYACLTLPTRCIAINVTLRVNRSGGTHTRQLFRLGTGRRGYSYSENRAP